MAEGPFGVRRPFIEETQQPLILIAKFSSGMDTHTLRNRSNVHLSRLETDQGFNFSKIHVDEGVTPFLVIEMLNTNLEYSAITTIHNSLSELDGFEGLTVSSVDFKQIERFIRTR